MTIPIICRKVAVIKEEDCIFQDRIVGGTLKLEWVSYQLKFKHPFGVSSNTRQATTSVFVRIKANGLRGYGEACLPAYLGESESETILFFKKAAAFLRQYDPVMPIRFFLDEMEKIDAACNAAKAAIDLALHDLYGKLGQVSYRGMMGIDDPGPLLTSYTIGIDSEEKLEQKIAEASQFHILKIKAGTKDDKALIKMVRKYTSKPLYVDVNQGWTDKNAALQMLEWMHDEKVLLVEQPMHTDLDEEMPWLTEHSPIATIADESVRRLSDLEKMRGAFTGINIKLMKCTGLREALKMIAFCKKNNIEIMLGCMAESSCATTAMAQLAGLADYIDLDAPLLYVNDPFKGIQYQNGAFTIPASVGLGASPFPELFGDEA